MLIGMKKYVQIGGSNIKGHRKSMNIYVLFFHQTKEPKGLENMIFSFVYKILGNTEKRFQTKILKFSK